MLYGYLDRVSSRRLMTTGGRLEPPRFQARASKSRFQLHVFSSATNDSFMDNLVTSNIRQRPIRTMVSVAGIALGVCLVMLFTGLTHGMSMDLQRRASNVRAELIFMRPGAIQATSASLNLDVRYADRLK